MNSPSIEIRSNRVTLADWKRAMAATAGDLPVLDPAQRELAAEMGMSEEEYALQLLAQKYGKQTLEERAQKLSLVVRRLLGNATDARLCLVMYEGMKLRWILGIERNGEERRIAIGQELVDDLLDSGLYESEQQLKHDILAGLAGETVGSH
jgi:hypothetical protein